MTDRPITRALISVSDKTGIADFARQLQELGVTIISTGGTSALLREEGICVEDVADITGFPEIMDGRVKSLHPKIHGGILGKRGIHAEAARQHDIDWIDLVVVNLYPFAKVIQRPDCRFDEAVENIDIGGPAMIRSAAKNMADVTVVVDPADYAPVVQQIQQHRVPPLGQRQALAQKAFTYTAEYDRRISNWLASAGQESVSYPARQLLDLEKITELRYGENPHQSACAYRINGQAAGILDARQHQGKMLSYNNIVDADAAMACVQPFDRNACVIVKHANPCGVACADSTLEAFEKALAADASSAFGGIIALNRECDEATAKAISAMFFEVVIAPGFSPQTLQQLNSKPALRLLETPSAPVDNRHNYQLVSGLLLAQENDINVLTPENLKIVTEAQPTPEEIDNLLFAWHVVQHVKSNAIVISKDAQTVGIGPGQVSRVGAVDIAIGKAGDNTQQAALASDAFFPFRDSIDVIAKAGIRTIIQPGGSIRDEEVIDACNAHGIAMAFTGVRCFRH